MCCFLVSLFIIMLYFSNNSFIFNIIVILVILFRVWVRLILICNWLDIILLLVLLVLICLFLVVDFLLL